MASNTAKTMREEAICPICLELVTEPVMIDCGHIYCHSCMMRNIENKQKQSPSQGNLQQSPSQENFHCPVCRAEFQRESIRPSKQLESIIGTIRKMEQEHLCEEHGEKLSLFCEDDDQLICWRCERTPEHRGHTTVLAEDACQSHKEVFQKILTSLRKLEDQNKEWQQNRREQMRKFQSEILDTKEFSQFVFKEIHHVLRVEEDVYLRKLEKEKEKILKRLQDSEAQIEKQSQELNKHMLELERKCQGSAQELLQDVRDTLDRISTMKLNAPEDVSWHIQTLPDPDCIFCEFTKLAETYNAKITLDPDTAHNDLLVNEDENKVTGGSPQVKHETPARFRDLPCVLGCEVFNSGKHYFKVDNITGTEWDVGVCLENVPRDNDKTRDPETGFWAIRRCRQRGYVALTSPLTSLCLEEEIRCLRVFLDYEAGLVSFYNSDTSSHIFTFPQASFSGPIRPYFRIGEDSHLCIDDPDL
ncbi:E3 ubiquitin-protein ligase TRIM38-like [Sorex araneus]|uniref:E3 ubiquitin-protein ligase TRIM38-like n=1 Tax=Sorex araneus TaxID=42254 RepID=UPI002433B498|nr:E3 ubiquitin-protein ligase TRIM38-like [Sorex araneus]